MIGINYIKAQSKKGYAVFFNRNFIFTFHPELWHDHFFNFNSAEVKYNEIYYFCNEQHKTIKSNEQKYNSYLNRFRD